MPRSVPDNQYVTRSDAAPLHSRKVARKPAYRQAPWTQSQPAPSERHRQLSPAASSAPKPELRHMLALRRRAAFPSAAALFLVPETRAGGEGGA